MLSAIVIPPFIESIGRDISDCKQYKAWYRETVSEGVNIYKCTFTRMILKICLHGKM